jgi:Ca2+-binding EF-hand superfamily protein
MGHARMLSVIFLLIVGAAAQGQTEEKKKPLPLPPALAEILKATPDELLKRFDKNGDGALSKEELPPLLARNFEKADRDSNGKLDREEIAVMLKVVRANLGQLGPPGMDIERFVDGLLQQQDANKDGKISRAEAKGRLAEAFDRIDTNKDGYLDRAELRVLAQRVMASGGPGGFAEAKGPGPDFDALDKNADGRLSREELRGTPFAARFAEIDADGNGSIDRREFERFLQREAKK